MGFRFFRRMKIAPGLTLNLSKSGPLLSFGARGAKVTVGRGGVGRTVGIPGTGLFYTTTGGRSRRSRRGSGKGAGRAADEPLVNPSDRLKLNFFRRLVTPKREEHFVDGMRALVGGEESAAMRHFEQADDLADASLMASVLALKRGKFDTVEGHLKLAAACGRTLGKCFAKYGVAAEATLTFTDEVSAAVNADMSGALLALAEVHQPNGKHPVPTENVIRAVSDELQPNVLARRRIRPTRPASCGIEMTFPVGRVVGHYVSVHRLRDLRHAESPDRAS